MTHVEQAKNHKMTREEFFKGWFLLVAQPWGKRYGQSDEIGQLQSDFYYSKFQKVNPFLWLAICEQFAEGSRWPSVEMMRETINANMPAEKHLTKLPEQYADKPEALAVCLSYQDDIGCSANESYLAVLPKWLSEHPKHADREEVERLLEQARASQGKPVVTPLREANLLGAEQEHRESQERLGEAEIAANSVDSGLREG